MPSRHQMPQISRFRSKQFGFMLYEKSFCVKSCIFHPSLLPCHFNGSSLVRLMHWGGGGVALQLFWSVGYVIHFCNLHEKGKFGKVWVMGGGQEAIRPKANFGLSQTCGLLPSMLQRGHLHIRPFPSNILLAAGQVMESGLVTFDVQKPCAKCPPPSPGPQLNAMLASMTKNCPKHPPCTLAQARSTRRLHEEVRGGQRPK